MVELDHRSVCRKTGVSPEVEMDIVTGVELECSYGAGDGWTRSRVASMPKERSGGPRLDRSCDWEKYGYDNFSESLDAFKAYYVNKYIDHHANMLVF